MTCIVAWSYTEKMHRLAYAIVFAFNRKGRILIQSFSFF